MLDEAPLTRLLSACADGRQEALKELYDQASPKLLTSALYLLRDRGLAEEALQETFVHIWYKAADYAVEKGHPFAWMVTILRNRCLDILRREGRHQNKMKAVEADPLQTLDTRDVLHEEWGSLDPFELRLLQECLQQLQQEQRKSLLMAYYYGFSHSEMVEKLQRPLGTVKSWIRRAMQSVRECMQK